MMRSLLVLTLVLGPPAWADVLIPLRNIRAQEIVTRTALQNVIADTANQKVAAFATLKNVVF